MIVAVINSLHFKADKLTQTVFYYENCSRLEFTDYSKMTGNLEAVVATDIDEAVEKLRGVLKTYLDGVVWGKPNPKDFSFTMRYSEVAEGKFWITPTTLPLREFEVETKPSLRIVS